MRREHGRGYPSPEHGEFSRERVQPIRVQDQREGSLTHEIKDKLTRLRMLAEPWSHGEYIFSGGQFKHGLHG
jgi:hypothetical protein